MEKTTKVQAVAAFLKENGGSATWSEIYDNIEQYWPGAKADTEIGKAGLRGVVNREIGRDRVFERAGRGAIALKD